jgi:serine/threonine protein kinase
MSVPINNLMDRSPEDFVPYSGRVKEDTLVANRYYVVEKLGDGCYAKVYLVQDITNNEIYALKAINKIHFKSNSKLRFMLDKEAKIHKSLNHENIVKLEDYFEDANYVFFLLEYIFPGELFEILNKKKGFSEKVAADYIFQTVLALRHCQDHEVIHRDLKPENLLLNEDGVIKLADFGWATHRQGNSVVGSVHYNSPEMLRYQKYDYRSDIWAVGVLIYELLCCQQPFRGTGRNQSDREKETEKLIKQCKIYENRYTKDISKDGWSLITRILVLDPTKRPTYDQILADKWFKNNLTAEQLARAERPSNSGSSSYNSHLESARPSGSRPAIIMKKPIRTSTSSSSNRSQNSSTTEMDQTVMAQFIKLSKPITDKSSESEQHQSALDESDPTESDSQYDESEDLSEEN